MAKILIKSGEALIIGLQDDKGNEMDGTFTVSFGETSITIEAEFPGNKLGNAGVIYEEEFIHGDSGLNVPSRPHLDSTYP
jgi:hypothetical protein